jgi:uncharacterized protein (DUF1697 family)
MKHVAFLRAINVGGRAVLKMSDLQLAFARAGGRDVRTLIQSGNVIFEASAGVAPGVVRKAAAALRRKLGVEPEVVLRTLGDIEALVHRAPFTAVEPVPTTKLYVAFLSCEPSVMPALPLISRPEALEIVGIDGREAFIVSRRKKNGFFGFPNNFIEQQLRISATTRNWSTVTRIAGIGGK